MTFSTTARNGDGRSSPIGCARPWMIVCNTSRSVAPANGRRPATISYRTTPKEKMSLRASRRLPVACSGDMYAMVPRTMP